MNEQTWTESNTFVRRNLQTDTPPKVYNNFAAISSNLRFASAMPTAPTHIPASSIKQCKCMPLECLQLQGHAPQHFNGI